jgi:DNA-binding GntR family transcriptional regulator
VTAIFVGVPKKPEYVVIAETLKAEVLAGDYDHDTMPGNATLAERFDVNMKTAGRAIQQLIAEGVLMARPGMRAVPVPPQLRGTKWPMTGRYARARAAQGLLFSTDVTGAVRKDTVRREWVAAPALIAQFLDLDVGTRVFQRCSRTFVDDVPTEDTSMFFPAAIVAAAPRLERDDRIQVVPLVEAAGHVITRTTNELRARLATTAEQELFGLAADGIVIEHSHGTYGAEGEAVEAVINIRPAHGNVITFETYEGPVDNN